MQPQQADRDAGALPYARDLFQTPGFGDTIDFDHIKWHYYCVHRDINPNGIVPAGPDPSAWLTPHHRHADWRPESGCGSTQATHR